MTHTVHRRLALLLLALGLVLPEATAIAQPQGAKLKHFTVRDGLPFGGVGSIVQDREGFMWIGTDHGLYRHDGYTFAPYRHDPDDPRSLAADTVQSLYVDRQGTLWVSMYRGLDRYEPLTDTFAHLRHDPDDPGSLSSDSVQVVLEDRSGTLWVGTWGGGLNRVDRETGAFTVYRHDPADEQSLGSDYVEVLYEDGQGVLWIGTRGGLNRFDSQTETWRRYVHDAEDETSLMSDTVTAIEEDAEGRLWVGADPGWLHRMDPDRSGRFTRYKWFTGLGRIYFIHASRGGTLWTGSNNCCLGRYDPTTDTFHGQGLPSTLVTASMLAIHASRDGTLWFGMGKGLARFDPTPPPITTIRYAPPLERNPNASAVFEDREGTLWIGGGRGLLRYDRKADRSIWYVPDPEDPTSLFEYKDDDRNVYQIYEDRAGVLWINGGRALSTLNRRTGVFTHYRHDPHDEASLSDGIMSGVQEDQAGNLWVAALGFGLNKMDRNTGRFTRFSPLKDGIEKTTIQTFLIARDETIWLGLGSGFLRFDPDTETFTEFAPPDSADPRVGSDVHVMYEDRRGRIWYGAPHGKGGLNIFDPSTQTFAHLPSEARAIYGIQEDLQGNVWVHADDRVLMVDPETGIFTSFDEGSGLTGWIADFTLGQSTHGSATGELFFGVVGGVKSFFPEQILAPKASRPPPVALTAFELFSQPVRPEAEGPLKTSTWDAERITLAHDQHTFAFTFAALDYRNPSVNRHRYLLENYDETWREAGPERRADYVRVPPGRYVFRVQAANSDGVWNEEGVSVTVVVLPPWWRTTWAYLLYGVLFIGAVFAVDRVQRRRLLRRERERAMQRELQQKRAIEQAHTELQQAHTHLKATQAQLVQSEKMASLGALTAGIAHEIKNPLNFVNNFADLNVELTRDIAQEIDTHKHHLPQAVADDLAALLSDLKINTEKIEEHGRRADGIVRAMMDHARGGEGERRAVEVNVLVEEYLNLAYHGMRANVPAFNTALERDYDASVGAVEMVPQDIGRVLINLLNNAFDAVHARVLSSNGQVAPTVRVSTRQVQGRVEVRVGDNGPGIPLSIRDRIFEPFFTTKPTGSGTGLGLSLSYDIVTQGHGGTMTVESEEGEGATFIVTLPA